MKLSPKQISALNGCDKKINFLCGSVRSGKTFVTLWIFIKEVLRQHMEDPEKKKLFAIICVTIKSFRNNILPLLEFFLDNRFNWFPGKQEIILMGERITVVGASDERAVAKVKGCTLDAVMLDELTELPQSLIEMVKSRCTFEHAKMYGTTNPDSPHHFIKTDYIDSNPDVNHWHFTLDDNPALKDSEREFLKRQHKGMRYRRFILGDWCLAEGCVYDFFTEDNNVDLIPPTYATEYIAALDYGTTNPFVCLLIGINLKSNNGKIWVEKELYWDSKKEERQKTDWEYADDVEDFLQPYGVKTVYVDPSCASFKLELRRRRLPVADANNEVDDGIRCVAKHLASGDLRVMKECVHTIKEFYSYVWDDKASLRGIDKPLKRDDHCMDALRYGVFSKFGMRDKLQPYDKEAENNRIQQRMRVKNPFNPNSHWRHIQ